MTLQVDFRRNDWSLHSVEGLIGSALLKLFEDVPTLNELAITGSEATNCYLDVGLEPFLKALDRISNLEFLDISGNKVGDVQFGRFMESLRQNKTLRFVLNGALRCFFKFECFGDISRVNE